ncbi:histone deacetylase 4 isoform X2 [Patella vulgata]|uniref:histone deacetylase 4 isoform X2 n=1 Tax=Patella vulgata TaxID=6465 RepID=UPI0021806E05|nr:histone deacetylase 4 isoform X2 [Patella vulgata]
MSSNNYQYHAGNKFYKGSVDSGFQEPIDPLVPHDSTMEINSFPLMSRKADSKGEMFNEQQLEQQLASLKHQQQVQKNMLLQQFEQNCQAQLREMYPDTHLQQQLASIKQQQQLQHQLLLQQYEQQRIQLEQEHEKQLQDHIKPLLPWHFQGFLDREQQKTIEQHKRMEKELMEKEQLERIKNKNKEQESAIASTEVKMKLQEFVLTKKQREQAVKDLNNSPPQFRHPWVPNQSSLDQNSPPASSMSPPYPHPMLGKYAEDDFPLRKTASEPNILKVRSALKQKLETRRGMNTHSPLVRRREKGPLPKRKTALSIETGVCSSNPDSGPNSPPGPSHSTVQNGSLPKEDNGAYPFQIFRPGLSYPGAELSLYTSPSMPNISLGRPPKSGASSGSPSSSISSEEQLHAAMVARLGGLPISGPMLPGALPAYYQSLPPEGEFPGGTAAYLAAQAKLTSSPLISPYTIPTSASGISESPHPAHRLHRHKPLGRTHSAPLPLGHPAFQQQQQLLQQQHEHFIKENQKLYLKQHIRQTVLQRAGSKGHMENVDEETEVKLAQEMKESREQDQLREDKMDEEAASELAKQQKGREAFLGQQREIIKGRHRGPSHHRPLSRTQSSPLVTFSVPPQSTQDTGPVTYTFTTGIVYDTVMLKHTCTCGNNDNHLEHAGRIQSIWNQLEKTGLTTRCERVRSRKATLEELRSCHTETYTSLYATNPLNRHKLLESSPMRFCLLPCGGVGVDSDTVWNDLHTSTAARIAAGSVTELACRVAVGELKNGLAIVRPPGHHAEAHQPMGFCYFNSIAIAAKQLKEKCNTKKVLIVDWDVHHGNGTQQMFYDNPHVLYISIHRHDNGHFFPGTGAPDECGADSGQGFNVNIAFGGSLNPPMRDAEYLAAFRTVVMPIAREFRPEIVLVSAGFDAAKGHPPPLGGYEVSSTCFSHMTRELMALANGKIVLCLEGGYDIPSICSASEACVKALLGDELDLLEEESRRKPCQPAQDSLETAIRIQTRHWPCVKRYLGTIDYSLLEAQTREREEAATVSALASLSMVPEKKSSSIERESEPMEEES